MRNICHQYSLKWRYDINPSKSNMIVFGETNRQQGKLSVEHEWKLCDVTIHESITRKHVGIILQSDLKSIERTLNACTILRSTFMSIVGVGAQAHFMHPISAKKLYLSICLPIALYGCELWYQMSKTDENMLEKTHRFCVKYLQGFKRRTRTVISYAAIGIARITTYIHIRQLLFLGRLCTLPNDSRVKVLFLLLLAAYFQSTRITHTGYISNIVQVFNEYELSQYLYDLYNNGVFSTKIIWKRMVNYKVKKKYCDQWAGRISADQSLQRAGLVSRNPLLPFKLWSASKMYLCMKYLFHKLVCISVCMPLTGDQNYFCLKVEECKSHVLIRTLSYLSKWKR